MEGWYLAALKPGKDNIFKAQMMLERRNIMAFSPLMFSFRPRADRPGQQKKVIEPLFPGYMFICFDPEIFHSSKVESCPGISHLVRFAGAITPIREAAIEEVMELPVCVQDFSSKRRQRKKHAARAHLSHHQRQQIQAFVNEHDGETRSAMLHAFINALK
ncbi:transcription termination/antitermination NusG family protein [Serratia sp. CY68758]|uniref:transcription termination/antitermination NusG family protein n=1 Tax=Serratia TaxID=613 RepID=UPI00376B847E